MEYKVKYLIGYPGWDKPEPVTLIIEKGSLRITQPLSSGKNLVVQGKDILDVSFEAQTKRSGTRAATGALIGGVLTGGIGLLAGAAIGAKAKNKSELTFLFNENGRERIITLQTKEKTNAIFNAIQDAIAYSKDHPDEVATLKSNHEKLKEQPMEPGAKILAFIFVVAIIVFVVWLFKECAEAWNAVAV